MSDFDLENKINNHASDYNEPKFNLVFGIFSGIILLALAQLLDLLKGESFRPLGDQLGVTLVLFFISIYSFFYFYQYIRYFQQDYTSNKWTIITVAGGGVLVLASFFNFPFFYSLISIALLLIYLKLNKIVKSVSNYDRQKFAYGYLELYGLNLDEKTKEFINEYLNRSEDTSIEKIKELAVKYLGKETKINDYAIEIILNSKFYIDSIKLKFIKIKKLVFGLFIMVAIVLGVTDYAHSKVSSEQGVVKILSNYFKYENKNSKIVSENINELSKKIDTRNSIINQILPLIDDSSLNATKIKEGLIQIKKQKSEIQLKIINENSGKLYNNLESSIYSLRVTGLVLAFLIIVMILYVIILKHKVKHLPSNLEIKEVLKRVFWKVRKDDNNSSYGGETNSDLDKKSLFFISQYIFRPWPCLVSALISTHFAWQFSSNLYEPLLIFISVFSVTAYGFTINNIVDRFKDKYAIRKKYKLVNNPLSLLIAKTQAILFLLIALISSFYLPQQSIIVIISVILLLSIYSWVNNNYGIAANLLTSIFVALLVWVYPIEDKTQLANIILLSIYLFFYIFSREIIMDDYDYNSDFKYGKDSLPIVLGRKKAILLSLSILILTILMSVFLILYLNLNLTLLTPILGASLISLTGYLKYYKDNSIDNFNLLFKLTSLSYLTVFGVFLI